MKDYTIYDEEEIGFLNLTKAYEKDNPYPIDDIYLCTHYCQNVYLFYNPITKFIKIGITKNPRIRLKALSANCGVELDCLLILTLQPNYNESAPFVEYYLHQYFKSKRQTGEWFSLDSQDIWEIKYLFWELIEGEAIEDFVEEFFPNPNLKI